MKEYKYTINGNKYEVTIGDIVENIANITVNGEEYKVEMEPEAESAKPKVMVRSVANTEETANPTSSNAKVNT